MSFTNLSNRVRPWIFIVWTIAPPSDQIRQKIKTASKVCYLPKSTPVSYMNEMKQNESCGAIAALPALKKPFVHHLKLPREENIAA